MARTVDVKQQNWARWEGDVVTPSLDMIVKILREHPCPTDWLLGLKERVSAAVKVTNSPGAAVANGRNARASVGPSCEQCPFKMLAMEFKDRAAKLPRKR